MFGKHPVPLLHVMQVAWFHLTIPVFQQNVRDGGVVDVGDCLDTNQEIQVRLTRNMRLPGETANGADNNTLVDVGQKSQTPSMDRGLDGFQLNVMDASLVPVSHGGTSKHIVGIALVDDVLECV